MQEINDISKQPLVEWAGQVVITTAQLAEVYGTTTKNVSNNFSRNKDRFVEGKHYFVLQGEDLKEFGMVSSERGQHPKTSILYLWTRRGASRHCKILGTDKAWEQFDYLEDNYFDRAEKKKDLPLTLKEQIQTIAQGTSELYQRVDAVTEDVKMVREDLERFKADVPAFNADTKEIQSALRKKAIEVLGGKNSDAYRDKSIHGYTFSDIQIELRRQFGVKRYDQIKHKDVSAALEVIKEYKPPIHIKDKINMANAQQSLDLGGAHDKRLD